VRTTAAKHYFWGFGVSKFTTFPPRSCFGVEIWAGEHGVFFAAAKSAVGASVDMVVFSECPLLFERAEGLDVDFAHHK
jgi:hypothetical protein